MIKLIYIYIFNRIESSPNETSSNGNLNFFHDLLILGKRPCENIIIIIFLNLIMRVFISLKLNCITKTISKKVTLDVTHNFELTSQ